MNYGSEFQLLFFWVLAYSTFVNSKHLNTPMQHYQNRNIHLFISTGDIKIKKIQSRLSYVTFNVTFKKRSCSMLQIPFVSLPATPT